jgi:hypothetical protein
MEKPGAIKILVSPFPSLCPLFAFHFNASQIRLLLSSGLLGLDTTDLGGRGILLGLLRATNSADTGDSGFPQIGTVSVLGGAAGDALVDPAKLKVW